MFLPQHRQRAFQLVEFNWSVDACWRSDLECEYFAMSSTKAGLLACGFRDTSHITLYYGYKMTQEEIF